MTISSHVLYLCTVTYEVVLQGEWHYSLNPFFLSLAYVLAFFHVSTSVIDIVFIF